MRSIHRQLKKSEWYDYDKDSDPKYMSLGNAGAHKPYFDRYWSSREKDFSDLMALLVSLRTSQAEIVATLYSAWNDFLLDGRAFTDDDLVHEVLFNWHDKKQRFSQDKWLSAVSWMREKGLVPTGYGQHTKPGKK